MTLLGLSFIEEVDFDLTSLANAFDLPGLSDMLHSIILEQIANLMVLPNVFPIKLADVVDLNKLRYPQPQGVVRVKIVEAKDLIAADFKLVGKGTSDPYAVVKVGAKTVKTSIINNTLTPVWNETFELIVDSADGQLLYIDVLDDDPGSKDDELGRVSMDLSKLKNDGFEDEWLPLEGVKQGTIHVQLTWLWLANDPEELERVSLTNIVTALSKTKNRTFVIKYCSFRHQFRACPFQFNAEIQAVKLAHFIALTRISTYSCYFPLYYCHHNHQYQQRPSTTITTTTINTIVTIITIITTTINSTMMPISVAL
ncbi:extended synaptotagmin-like protein 2 [Plakobranchus ocellatus]|uniref:Extended synaptotagmin-like protein 2 n=1 Tax=Plakobranchus ocellatus TaxID=259542 RepID=A0AAV3Z385_9GAST|nr:extended synaptotagmin-like protein 2 [Plakobranchus ocellatus]